MFEEIHKTSCGHIHYWVNKTAKHMEPQLIFLPGLTADHRLFEKQIEYFEERYPVLVWDAPGHASSWPFRFDFNLMDKAKWLDEILTWEGFDKPFIIGQSMGGYVGQAYAQLFPGKLQGFVSIDSAPLQREYVTAAEIWLLKRVEPMEANLPYEIKCPALLICGTKDHAGSCIRYNKAWHKKTGIPIKWIKGAGHNANTDAPKTVNRLIERML